MSTTKNLHQQQRLYESLQLENLVRQSIDYQPTTSNRCHHHQHRRLFSTAATVDSDSDDGTTTTTPYQIRRRIGVRNVAIIAHVDHGKTTLVDQLLRAGSSAMNNNNSYNSNGNNSKETVKTNSSDVDGTTDRLLDCGDLEKERGITITSKVTRIDNYEYSGTDIGSNTNNEQKGSYTINVVDTPGHADFCGEVDRILSLVDGVCLVVDAAEGPMAQTKYVLSRALAMNLPPIVVLNKVDRSDGWNRIESGETESELLDLLDALGASEDVMDKYVTVYASARDGWVTDDVDVAHAVVHKGKDTVMKEKKGSNEIGMTALLNKFVELIPEPIVHVYNTDDDDDGVDAGAQSSLRGEDFNDDKFSLAIVTVGYDPYLGRTCTGRIYSGSVSINDQVSVVRRSDEQLRLMETDTDSPPSGTTTATAPDTSTLKGIFVQKGISRVPLESGVAYAGDIVLLAGVPDSVAVGDTLTGLVNEGKAVSHPIPTPPLAPPTLSMEFGANNGPLAGTEGTEVTPSKLRARLKAETDNNVTLSVKVSTSDSDKTAVYARGELQLGILIEQMRREGFEMVISPPRIVTKIDETDGKTVLEPIEEVTVDVDAECTLSKD
jgi:GTP-binding protein